MNGLWANPESVIEAGRYQPRFEVVHIRETAFNFDMIIKKHVRLQTIDTFVAQVRHGVRKIDFPKPDKACVGMNFDLVMAKEICRADNSKWGYDICDRSARSVVSLRRITWNQACR